MPRRTASPPRPSTARETVRHLGQAIRTARLRRRWSQALLAEKAGIAQMTLRSLEKGNPGVSLGVYTTVLWALGLEDLVAQLADPMADPVGVALSTARLGTRVRRKRELDDDF